MNLLVLFIVFSPVGNGGTALLIAVVCSVVEVGAMRRNWSVRECLHGLCRYGWRNILLMNVESKWDAEREETYLGDEISSLYIVYEENAMKWGYSWYCGESGNELEDECITTVKE